MQSVVAGLMNANQNNQTISALPPVMIHLQAARSYLYQAITPGAPKYPDNKTPANNKHRRLVLKKSFSVDVDDSNVSSYVFSSAQAVAKEEDENNV